MSFDIVWQILSRAGRGLEYRKGIFDRPWVVGFIVEAEVRSWGLSLASSGLMQSLLRDIIIGLNIFCCAWKRRSGGQ